MNKLNHYINNSLSIKDEYQMIFGRPIPSNKMFCPFHDNKNTPAAKNYGNIIKCFSCNKSYTVYDLLRKFNYERIKEIKETVIVPEQEGSPKSRVNFIKVERSKPMTYIINQILTANS